MNISICGAGTMGRGIAIACLQAGHSVVVFDMNETAVSLAKDYIIIQMNKSVEKKKITKEDADTFLINTTYSTAAADLASSDIIIEAIVEKPEPKFELFASIENSGISEAAIIATNTSSLSVNLLGSKLKNPQNFVGLHFFNPANLMKLVEIVRSRQTSNDTIERCSKFIKELGKTAVIAKDVPGFIVNRVARNYYNEAMKIATESAAEPEQIDKIMKSLGFKMGPFELMDLIGNDVNLAVSKSVYEQYFHEARFTPSTMQQEIVNAGLYGRKTGKGFHNYEVKKNDV